METQMASTTPMKPEATCIRKAPRKAKPIPEGYMSLEEFGNLGGASIPSLMVTRIADKLRKEPTTILGSSFGLGLSWGTMLLKTKPMVIPEMLEI